MSVPVVKNYPVRFLRRFLSRKRLVVFETGVGVKYRFGRFDSSRFSEYVIQEVPFTSTGLHFSELVIPLDLLRNRYTSCGRALLQSAHFRLMEEIENGTLTPDSEYISRCKLGTLDARLPFSPELEYLTRRYQLQKEELLQGKTVTIFVIQASLRDKPTYIIADGKHRAALVAYLDRPELLRIRLLSNAFAQDPFFQQVYSYTLGLDPREYSINQEMIKVILNES